MFTFERVHPGVMLVSIAGYDKGDFDTAPLDEIVAEMQRYAPLELFIDASRARGVAWKVSQQWTSWFRTHWDRLSRVNILVRSKYVKQTILVAKELSRTKNLLCLYSDVERFTDLLKERNPHWRTVT